MSCTNLVAEGNAGRDLNLRADRLELGGGVDQPLADASRRTECAHRVPAGTVS